MNTNRDIVLLYAKMYSCGSNDPKDFLKDSPNPTKVSLDKNKEYMNISFYPVGHNSSHNFYLGVDENDNAYYMAYSCYSDLIEPCCCSGDIRYESHPCYDSSNIKEFITENVKKLDGWLEGKQLYLGHW